MPPSWSHPHVAQVHASRRIRLRNMSRRSHLPGGRHSCHTHGHMAPPFHTPALSSLSQLNSTQPADSLTWNRKKLKPTQNAFTHATPTSHTSNSLTPKTPIPQVHAQAPGPHGPTHPGPTQPQPPKPQTKNSNASHLVGLRRPFHVQLRPSVSSVAPERQLRVRWTVASLISSRRLFRFCFGSLRPVSLSPPSPPCMHPN